MQGGQKSLDDRRHASGSLLTQCLHSLAVRNVTCLPQCLHALCHRHEEIVSTAFVFRNVASQVTCASLCTAVMAGSYLVCCLIAGELSDCQKHRVWYPTCQLFFTLISQTIFDPVRTWLAVRSKAYVCGRSLAGIVGSNPVGGMDVCLL
jgi:hypothetical protein